MKTYTGAVNRFFPVCEKVLIACAAAAIIVALTGS
jgi:hypothetical protein